MGNERMKESKAEKKHIFSPKVKTVLRLVLRQNKITFFFKLLLLFHRFLGRPSPDHWGPISSCKSCSKDENSKNWINFYLIFIQ